MIEKEKLFGTDGIRGTPGVYPLTEQMISRIGVGIARFINQSKKLNKKALSPCVVIAKDTRLSGHLIENVLAKSIRERGIKVILAGIITTPGLSFLTRYFQADIGIMISASHNKASDNGIKFFNSKGHKLSSKEENRLEEIIFDSLTHTLKKRSSVKAGSLRLIKNAKDIYVKFLTSVLKGLDLKGTVVALDCASGAASPFAKKLFTDLGAKVYCINDSPAGDNINVGGAIDPSFLKALVLKSKADIGIAVDGDGDRGILVNEKGEVLDGDYIMTIMAKHLMQKRSLNKKTIVTTIMSNYGLKQAIEESGGRIITTDVGDKHVLAALLRHKLNLGGEQSGHIIFLDYLATPDGLLTALQVLKVMRESNTSLSSLSKCISKFPQILVNVRVKERRHFEDMPYLDEKVRRFNTQLKDEGRILLRYSGTEDLARIMVEGRNKRLITNIANSLAKQIKTEIGV